MNKEIISTKQGYYIAITYVFGTSLILSRSKTAMQDTWISILIAMVMVIPLVLIYGKISKMFPGHNLYKILELVFGKVVGKGISILYTWYFLHLGSIVIRDNTEFIQIISLEDTPKYFTSIFFILLAIYMVKSGVEVLGRWSNIAFPFVFTLLILVNIAAISDYKYENIKPILYNGWVPVFKGAYSIFSFPFADTVAFLTIFNSLRDLKKVNKVYIVGILVGGLALLITILKNMFVLGFPLLSYVHFPTHYANMVISLQFLQRIEIVASVIFIFSSITKLFVCLFASCIGIAQIFNFSDYKDIAVPVGIMMIPLSLIIFTNTLELIEFTDIYHIYALPFQIIFPILILDRKSVV